MSRKCQCLSWWFLLLAGVAIALPARAEESFAALLANQHVALPSAIRDARRQPVPPLLSRESLLRRAIVDNVELSPDSNHVVYRRNKGQQIELRLLTLDNGHDVRVLTGAERLRVEWSGDSRRLWLADRTGLAIFEVAAHQVRRIYKWDNTREQRLWTVDARAPEFALISEASGQGQGRRYRYLRIDAQGKTIVLHESVLPLRDVLLDRPGRIAFSAAYEGARYDTVIRQHDRDGHPELLRCHGIESCRLVGFSETGSTLTILSQQHENTLALQQWSAKDPGWRTLHRDPVGIADASAVLWPAGGSDWLAIAYHRDHRHWYGRDARIHTQLTALQQQLPEANLDLSTGMDGRRWLVTASHATWTRDRYYLYTPEQGTLQRLFADDTGKTDTPPASLAKALPIVYRAGDGLPLYGYVYLPHGVPVNQAALIAVLHGGPFNRSRDAFDPVVQLLVNRGHVVFTPNFRASIGYGLHHVLAANGDFGNGRVLSDSVEGLDFLLEHGIGDRKQQAVIGHSFGGYASLLAISHHRNRFRFAVASAAPVDFAWGMQWIERHGGSALPADGPPAPVFFSHYGIPTSDKNWQMTMQRDSPLAHASGLRTPVYLWAGARDDRVPIQSVVRFAAVARQGGAATTLLIDPDSGHNPDQPLSLEAIVYLVEQAASRHFGSDLMPPSAPLTAFLGRASRMGYSSPTLQDELIEGTALQPGE